MISGTSIGRTDNTGNLDICGGTSYENGAFIALRGKDNTNQKGVAIIGTNNGSSSCDLNLFPDGNLTWGSKNVAMAEYVIPIWGGAVMTGNNIARVDIDGGLSLLGGTGLADGSSVNVFGKSFASYGLAGAVRLITNDGSNSPNMYMFPNGSWQWQGQAVQLISDQRLKQQIAQIDNALLDAWEDVEPVQFKYNDAVNEKGDNARLHTGYVVQQIDTACKSHNVDISEYGLYCHEEYPQETEEVEVNQDDGTIKKETKVIREASEHYSLRYTETLVVECAYLRRENNRLKERLSKIEKLLNI